MLTSAQLKADIDVSPSALDTAALGLLIRDALPTAAPYTAKDIRDAFYDDARIVTTTTDATELVAGLGTISTAGLSFGDIATRIYNNLNALTPGYTATDVSTAIVRGVTPNPQATLHLNVEELVLDIEFTLHDGFDLTDLVAALLADQVGRLDMLKGDGDTTLDQLKQSIYDIDLVIAAPDHKNNFGYDIQHSIAIHNSYAAVQDAIEAVTGGSAAAIKTSMFDTALLQATYVTDKAAFQADVAATVTNGDFAGFLSSEATAVAATDISDVATAAVNLGNKVYSILRSVDSVNMQVDIKSANDIDNEVTLWSTIGSGSYCLPNSSHTVYKCALLDPNDVNSNLVVGAVIGTNDCSSIGLENAKAQCLIFATSGEDAYVSYDGITCTALLGDLAYTYCAVGLNYPALA